MADEHSEFEALPHAELVERARALQTVLRVTRAVAGGGSIEKISTRFVDAVTEYTRFPAVVVLRYMADDDAFEIAAMRGFDLEKFPPPSPLPAKGSLTGLAAQRGMMLTTDDIANDDRVEPDTRRNLAKNEYQSGACVPVVHDGELLGSINLLYPHGTALPESERRMLDAFATSLAVAMAQRLAVDRERELERQARRAQQLESLGVLAGGVAHDFNNLLMECSSSPRPWKTPYGRARTAFSGALRPAPVRARKGREARFSHSLGW